MDNKTPITLITGFLGAGKTTLLNQLIHQKKDEKVIIIVNELGDISIDYDLVLESEEERIYQLNDGCMCCGIRDDLLGMLDAILSVKAERGVVFDRIIIETSGLAVPNPIIQTLIQAENSSQAFTIDSVITLVDAQNAIYQLNHFEETVEQIAYADLVVVNKRNLVNDAQYQMVVQGIRDINPFVKIKDMDLNKIDYKEYIGLNLFTQSANNEGEIDHHLDEMLHHEHEHEHDHDHHDHNHHHSAISAFSLVTDKPLDETKIALWLNMLILNFGSDLIRYKGIMNVAGRDQRVILQGVHMNFNTELGLPWGGPRETKIVIIGKNLLEAQIKKLFEECIIEAENKANI